MDLETKNWLWLEKVAAIASKHDHQSAVEYAKSNDYAEDTRSEQDIDDSVFKILTDPSRYILLPQMMPGRRETKDLYIDKTKNYKLDSNSFESFEAEYINEDTSDPHVMKSLIKFTDILESQEKDPYQQSTKLGSFGDFLVVLDAGGGRELLKVMQQVPHNSLVIAVPNLRYLASSFKSIDWLELWNSYCVDDDKTITLYIFDPDNPSDGLLGSLCNQSIPGLDHSFLFYPNEDDLLVQEIKSKALSEERTHMSINYLGFAMDEYNMMWHSWHSILEEPKIFEPPSKTLGYPAVVVGSGPSLDDEIENIRKLADTHIIVAAASSSYALLQQNIEPDFIILLERGTHEVDNYTKLKEDFPKIKTKLVACVSCSYKLHSLFDESAIFFRAGSTPTTLFCPSPRNVLEFEGPQTVNTAVSFALRICSENVVLAGIDLGTTSLENPRSKGAVGISPRDFNLKEKGNFTDFVFTERELLDGALMMGDCINALKGSDRVYNASNGMYIKNTISKPLSDYINEMPADLDFNKQLAIDHFWSDLKYYGKSDLLSRWNACSPRKQALDICNNVYSIFEMAPQDWFVHGGKELTRALSIEKYMRNLFFTRIFRGTIMKTSLAMRRQMNLLKDNLVERDKFYATAADHMKSLISNMREEVFMMCDELESDYLKKAS